MNEDGNIPVIEGRVLNVELFEKCINFAIDSWNYYRSIRFENPMTEVSELEVSWQQSSWASVIGNPQNVELHQCRQSFCIAGAAWYFSGLVEKFAAKVTYENCCGVHGMAFDCHERQSDCEPMSVTTYSAKLVNLDKVFGPEYDGPTESHDDSLWPVGGEVLLGITHEEAEWLFAGSNGITYVVRQAWKIADRRGVTLNLNPVAP